MQLSRPEGARHHDPSDEKPGNFSLEPVSPPIQTTLWNKEDDGRAAEEETEARSEDEESLEEAAARCAQLGCLPEGMAVEEFRKIEDTWGNAGEGTRRQSASDG